MTSGCKDIGLENDKKTKFLVQIWGCSAQSIFINFEDLGTYFLPTEFFTLRPNILEFREKICFQKR